MTNKIKVTEQDMTRVYQVLQWHVGESKRVDVDEFAKSMGMSRRKLRAIVHEINCDDSKHLILTDTDEGGYWVADQVRDIKSAAVNFKAEESRGKKIIRKANKMASKAEMIFGKSEFRRTVAELHDTDTQGQGSLF